MISNFKLFERKNFIIYKNNDFSIYYNSNNILVYTSQIMECSAINSICNLISEKSKYLNDQKFRDIILRDIDIKLEIEYLTLNQDKIKNIEIYHSGLLRDFIGNNESEQIPKHIFSSLTLKYYSIISDAIKKSKTIGDIIDNFLEIYDQLMNDLTLELSANKYNL